MIDAGNLASGLAAAARCRREEMIALAESVAASRDVDVLRAPAAHAAPIGLSSSVGAFHLADAIVTTAQVRCGGATGWGCVLGWDQEGALAAALLDAVATPAVSDLALAALADEQRARHEISRRIAATKV